MTYAEQVAAFEAMAGILASMTTQLLRDGEELARLHSAMVLAFEERMQRPYRAGDQFTDDDEARAQQLLVEMYPASEA